MKILLVLILLVPPSLWAKKAVTNRSCVDLTYAKNSKDRGRVCKETINGTAENFGWGTSRTSHAYQVDCLVYDAASVEQHQKQQVAHLSSIIIEN